MKPQLRIKVIDPDPDYLGLEVFASSERFAGTTRIYAPNGELSALSQKIVGFPKRNDDQVILLFGTRDSKFAGGFCELQFFCTDGCGNIAIRVEIGDDDDGPAAGFGKFTIPAFPSEIDSFIVALNRIEINRTGTAELKSSDW